MSTAQGHIIASAETTASQREIINAVNLYGEEANLAFNESLVLSFEKSLDLTALEHAIQRLVKRHDSLRMTFNESGSQFYLHEYLAPIIEHHKLQNPEQLEDYKHQSVSETFNLQKGPLLRFITTQAPGGQTHCIITVHHIVCDGWSFAVLLEDLAALYKSAETGLPAELPKPDYFIDYVKAVSSSEYLECNQKDVDFWGSLYSPPPDSLDLPTSYPRPAARSLKSGYRETVIDKELTQKIRLFCRQEKSSLVNFLLTSFSIFLNKLTQQSEIVVALPSAGQSIESLERVIGQCVNTLPIFINVDASDDLKSILNKNKKSLLEQTNHSRLTLGELIKHISIKRRVDRSSIAAVMFNLDQDISRFHFADTVAHVSTNSRICENFEIFLNVVDTKEELKLQLQYSASLFSYKLIESWMNMYATAINKLLESNQETLENTELWDARLYFVEGCRKNIHELNERIFKHVKIGNNNAAVLHGSKAISYEELYFKVTAYIEVMAQKGVEKGSRVAICLSRNENLQAWLLACWKIGAAYVPCDPSFPKDRLNYMISESQPALILTDKASMNAIDVDGYSCLLVENVDEQKYQPSKKLEENTPVDDLLPAYIIFTSGSTGKPKGVVISRSAASNFIESMSDLIGMDTSDKLLAVTTLSFDISVLELFLPIWQGGTTIIATSEQSKDGSQLKKLIENHGVTIIQATPTTWRFLIAMDWQGSNKMKALCGGEAFPADLKDDLLSRTESLWNMYGPTETTVWSTCQKVEKNEPINIGRPIHNTQCYIVDKDTNKILPYGVKGELAIGGKGVATHYLNQPSLTEKVFVAHPMEDGERIYKTGDYACIQEDQSLQCFGRIDNQVKVRGYRIELGDIESALNSSDLVAQSAVILHEASPTDKKIVAFLEVEEGYNESVVKENITQILPNYMHPNMYVVMDKLPLTPNRKIDRKSLVVPKNRPNEVASALGEKLDPIEKKVLEKWQSLLNIHNLSLSDNFFESGGHSLLAMEFIVYVKNEFKFDLPIDSLLLDDLMGVAQRLGAKKRKRIVVAKSKTNAVFFNQGNLYGNYHYSEKNFIPLLIFQPIGHEYTIAHRLLKQLADRVAANYGPAFRFDYYGTGDSKGIDTEVSVDSIRQDACSSIDFLKEKTNSDKVIVLTSRFMDANVLGLSNRSDISHILEWDLVKNKADHFKILKSMHHAVMSDLDRYSFPRKKTLYSDSVELLGFKYSKDFIGRLVSFDQPTSSTLSVISIDPKNNQSFNWYSLTNLQVAMAPTNMIAEVSNFIEAIKND